MVTPSKGDSICKGMEVERDIRVISLGSQEGLTPGLGRVTLNETLSTHTHTQTHTTPCLKTPKGDPLCGVRLVFGEGV